MKTNLQLDLAPTADTNISPTKSTSTTESKLLITSETLTDSTSPQPDISHSPQDLVRIANQRNLQFILEEIKKTEASYLSDLKTLKRDYLETLIEDIDTEVPVPVKIVYSILTEMIECHDKMVRLFEQVNDEPNILKRSNAYCSIISTNGVNSLLIDWYCSVHVHAIPILLGSTFTLSNTSFDSWFRCWNNFSRTSLKSYKDLNLLSLLQRPTIRKSHHKLFLENILKCYVKLGFETSHIQASIDKICNDLNKINENNETDSIYDSLARLIDFSDLSYQTYNLDHKFFGLPYLIGTSWVIYIQKGAIQTYNAPTIVFKSHLLLLEYQNLKPDYKIKFIIPLEKCHLTAHGTSSPYGMHSTYQYCVKLSFEIETCKYEILLCWLTKQEYDVWVDELTVLIDFVNNNDNTTKSEVDTIQYLYRLPVELSCYDTPVETYLSSEDTCYFGDCIVINIEIDNRLKELLGMPVSHSIREKWKQKNRKVLYMRLKDLYWSEYAFQSLISKELIVHCRKGKPNKHLELLYRLSGGK
ncbi:hypothetical protein SBY92_000067 [Candida maltosa Xu316]